MMAVKAILLDVDNTLLDFDAYVHQAMAEGFAEFGLGTFDWQVYQTFSVINHGLWQALERGELSYEQLLKIRWNRVFEALGISFDGERFERYFKGRLFHNAIPIPGAMELLEYLKGKYILAVASNGPYQQQMNRLRIGGMEPYFQHFFISQAMGVQKPDPAFFAHCLSQINNQSEGAVLPEEVLMIGDSLSSDIAGAQAAGMQTCYFDKQGKGVSGSVVPDVTVTALSQIIPILEKGA